MHPADMLDETLEHLRGAALRGALPDLAPLAEQLETALNALDQARPAPARLHALRRRAQETIALLQAARQGVEAARQRLAELDALQRGLGTYARNGRRQQLWPGHQTTRRV